MLMIASCRDLPSTEVDDRPFHAALDRLGVAWKSVPWQDDPFDESTTTRLIRTTWDYHEHCDEFLGWIDRAEAAGGLWNPAATLRWNTHKTYLRDLGNAGVPVLPTCWLESGEPVDLASLLAEHQWNHAMLKPAVGATAHGTFPFVADEAGLAGAAAHLNEWLPRGTMLLQPFCKSVGERGELSLIMLDGAVTHAVRKIPVAGDYRVQDDFGATDKRVDIPDDVRDATERAVDAAAAATGVRRDDLLYARADFLEDDRGTMCLIELELIEPSLFFRHAPEAAERFAQAVAERVSPHYA